MKIMELHVFQYSIGNIFVMIGRMSDCWISAVEIPVLAR